MNAKETAVRWMQALCLRWNIAVNAPANRYGIPPSVIGGILNTKSKNPGIVTIPKICDGLEISLRG